MFDHVNEYRMFSLVNDNNMCGMIDLSSDKIEWLENHPPYICTLYLLAVHTQYN